MVATRVGRRVTQGAAFGFEVHSPDIPIPADVAAYAEEKLRGKLAKFGRRIVAIILYVKDVNGAKGGVDKSCHLEARMAGLEAINVQEQQEDLRAAIDLAIDELARAVRRQVERARTVPRDRGRKLVRHQKLAG